MPPRRVCLGFTLAVGVLCVLITPALSWPLGRTGPATIQSREPSLPGSCLIRLDTEDPADLRLLADGPTPPVLVLDGYALAWGTADDLPGIRRLGIPARILALRSPGKSFAVVYPGGDPRAQDRPALESLVRVLDRGRATAVVEYPSADVERISGAYFQIPVPDTPARFPALAGKSLPAAPSSPNPSVAQYVAQVDSARLVATIQRLQDYGSRCVSRPQAFEAADSIAGRFRSYGLKDSLFVYRGDWSGDVIGVQPGKVSPREIYVICAHYDAICTLPVAPGADDNATGTSAVLEAARLLSPDSFEATILYAAWSGEEEGLVGSEAWAQWAEDQGLDIRGVINLDMVGHYQPGLPEQVLLISNSAYREFAEQVLAIVPLYVPGLSLQDAENHPAGNLSDQLSFWRHGFPGVFFFEGIETPFYHTPGDLLRTSVNDIPYLTHNVQAAVAVLATLARPLRMRIDHQPPGDPSALADGYPLRARIWSRAPLLADSILVRYSVDGIAAAPLRMVAEGDSGDYAATIPRQRSGREVAYRIFARDEGGRVAVDPAIPVGGEHSFIVGMAPSFYDDFSQDRGWTVGSRQDNAVTGVWVRAVPVGTRAQPGMDADGDPSHMCYVTGNGDPGGEASASDVDGGRTTLTSPRIDLTAAPQYRVSYWRWFFDDTHQDDTLRVLLSNDDGATWSTLENVLPGSEASWVKARLEHTERILPPSSAMRLRFTVADYDPPLGLPSLCEAAVDGVLFEGVLPVDALPPPSPAAEIVRIWPSPLRGDVTIVYDLPRLGPARLEIFDVAGRRVNELPLRPSWTGRQNPATWNGCDTGGRRLPSGVYFLRLATDGAGTSTARIAVIH